MRIAPRGQKAGFCHKQRALAVGMDRAAFEHKGSRVDARHTERFTEFVCGCVIVLIICIKPVEIAAPGIEMPRNPAQLPCCIPHKGRHHIACPGVIGVDADKLHRCRQHFPRNRLCARAHKHIHLLALCKPRGDLRKCVLRVDRVIAPGARALREDHHSAAVSAEFRRHPKSISIEIRHKHPS